MKKGRSVAFCWIALVLIVVSLSGCGQRRLAQTIKALGPVAGGEGVQGALPYNPGEASTVKLVLLDKSGGSHFWNDLLPADWVPSSLGETTLAVILYDHWLVVDTKQYCGSGQGCATVSRQAHELDVVIREAASGQVLLTGTLKGPPPRQFPATLGQGTTEIKASPVDYRDLETWLRNALLEGMEAASGCQDRAGAPSLGTGSDRTREQDCMEMVYVPDGEFSMGLGTGQNRDEEPDHQVYLDAFYLDKLEVSNAQYALCVAAGACTRPARTNSHTRDTYYGDRQYMDYPVLNVYWPQAQAYCVWAGGRLPTEAQWEKGARGTGRGSFPWGAAAPTRELANFGHEGDTVRVGSYPDGASPYGALDMAGNAAEWVADWYAKGFYADSPASNPIGPSTGVERVVRGGHWGSEASELRAANRSSQIPNATGVQTGFRCATSP